MVEIVVKKHARCRYTTIQNWANNIYNLVTKRAVAYEDALMEWIDGNLGSRLTMKYPAVYMMEPGARGEILSIAFAAHGQHQDAGAKVVHCAPHTSSRIISKSDHQERRPGQLSRPGEGRARRQASRRANVVCDALILDPKSRSDTYPYIEIDEQDVTSATRPASRGSAKSSCSTCTSRGLSRGRGQHDDRQRLHRAAGQRAADGIRRRDEPADRAADGRLGGLSQSQITPSKPRDRPSLGFLQT